MSPKKVDRGKRDRSPLELTILGISIVAILAVVVALVGSGSSIGTGPPDLRVSATPVGGTASGGAPYAVVVRNVGGQSAESVEIEVTVGDEARTLSLVAVARGDEESATVIFPAGTTGEAIVDVQSYSEPSR